MLLSTLFFSLGALRFPVAITVVVFIVFFVAVCVITIIIVLVGSVVYIHLLQ